MKIRLVWGERRGNLFTNSFVSILTFKETDPRSYKFRLLRIISEDSLLPGQDKWDTFGWQHVRYVESFFKKWSDILC